MCAKSRSQERIELGSWVQTTPLCCSEQRKFPSSASFVPLHRKRCPASSFSYFPKGLGVLWKCDLSLVTSPPSTSGKPLTPSGGHRQTDTAFGLRLFLLAGKEPTDICSPHGAGSKDPEREGRWKSSAAVSISGPLWVCWEIVVNKVSSLCCLAPRWGKTQGARVTQADPSAAWGPQKAAQRK